MHIDKIRNLTSKPILSVEEVKEILDYLVNEIRITMDVNDSYTRMCKESSMKLGSICDRIDVPYIPFNMSSIGMGDLEHHYGITGFQTEYGQICFILDLTYIQFTQPTYPVNVNGNTITKYVTAPGNFITEKNKNNLIKDGYLIITEDNFDDYLRSFIETYKLVNPVNESQIYEKAYNELKCCGINFAQKDYLNNQGITY